MVRRNVGPIYGTQAIKSFQDCAMYDLDPNYCCFTHCEFYRVTFVDCRINRNLFIGCKFYECEFKGLSYTDRNDSAPIMFAHLNAFVRSLFYINTEEDAAAFRTLAMDSDGRCLLISSNIILDTNMWLSKSIKMQCPEAGSFVGYKKALYEDEIGFIRRVIIRLAIPEDAKRSSAFGKKCRCSKAVVENIVEPIVGCCVQTAMSMYDVSFKYVVGETVSVDDFDENRFNECAPGIHFFMTEEEAREYRF